ncbi:hypothetical protein rsdtw13_26100 [Clostridium sp. TW13]|uniref:Uncharacterized protein n=1 Tax=Inconstantimicrobium mannanitabidum TaxID=1604901 RepID=A0ACB5REY1_9CLOT|nr:hypothetical protein rsdtw13_26100 [Clostridium sp. TW13]
MQWIFWVKLDNRFSNDLSKVLLSQYKAYAYLLSDVLGGEYYVYSNFKIQEID